MEEFYNEFNGETYISFRDTIVIKDKYQSIYSKVKRNIFYFLSKEKRIFVKNFNHISNLVDASNEIYIINTLSKNKSLLDNITGFALDYNQRLVVVKEEDHTLVIAGAGSGKTLTIIGKIRYLIEKKFFDESEILCISFTNEATNKLKESLKNTYNYNINVCTFHKLALSILRDNGLEPSIAQPDTLEYIIDEFFDYLILDNALLLRILKTYFNDPYEKVKGTKKFVKFKKLIAQFIHLYKANIYGEEQFYHFLMIEKNKKNHLLLICIITIYNLYKAELISQNEIDFDDMIVEATMSLKEFGIKKKYRYIVIDEYQDSSFVRCNLIKELVRLSSAKLLAVGDDFQSIYRFTGCNLDIFINFKDYFINPDIIHINHTYRNAQELIDLAGNFIMRNKYQIKKQLKSDKHVDKPIKIVFYEEKKQDFKKLVNLILATSKLLILARNNNDIYQFIDDSFEMQNDTLYYNEQSIKYLTVHKSKGLEEENVILINLENSMTGFPNKMEDDEILKHIIKSRNDIPFEEERRLFYVALTRTKNNSYLFVPKANYSIFVKEIMCDFPEKIEFISIK